MTEYHPDSLLAAYSDGDYLLDSLRDDLRTDPIACALCGGPDAWRIVILEPDAIFYGPRGRDGAAIARGCCESCWTAVSVQRRLDYSERTAS